MGEAVEKKIPKEGTPLKMSISMDTSVTERLPAIYTNFASVKLGAEEVLIMFGLRDDFNGTFDGDEKIEVQAIPQIMMMMSFTQARALADTIQAQLGKIKDMAEKHHE
jgi:hypothetical protein